ncbi:hypothetical protein EMCRGX_G005289 [Ephydatia muelleri]
MQTQHSGQEDSRAPTTGTTHPHQQRDSPTTTEQEWTNNQGPRYYSEITIKQGVKQGCPLSPILFNLVMEVLIRAAEKVPEAGYKIANSTIKSLAYADDLCVLASSPQKLQEMVDRLHRASLWAGLAFSPRKCAALSIVRSYQARQRVDNRTYKLVDTVVPTMAWGDRYRYLGVKKGADHSPDLETVRKESLHDVQVIASSGLTDWQKLDTIHRFAKPRLVYALQNQLPPIQWGKALDKKVRALLKSRLKLPKRTNDSFLYAPPRAGGLGLPQIEDEIHIYGVSSAYRLLTTSNDPAVTDTAVSGLEETAKKRAGGRRTAEEFLNTPPERGEGKQGDIKSLWSQVRVSLQYCQAAVNLVRKSVTVAGREFGQAKRNVVCRAMRAAIQEGHLERWKRAKDQGRAAECVAAHPASNHWIKGGKYTSFCEYRFEHKARHLLPTRTVRRRSGEVIMDVSCPKCLLEQETLAHVHHHCPLHIGLIRARHNNILHRLAKAALPAKGRQYLEQKVPGDRLNLKPDLVILNEAKSEAYVVDVVVPFKEEDSFPDARKAKEVKYQHLKVLLRSKGNRRRLLVDFMKRSRDEYLGLRGMHRFSIATGGRGRHNALGDIVLVHDEAYPRTYWRLGKVERLIKGRDEQIRAAVVPVASRSETTTLKRPVQLL